MSGYFSRVLYVTGFSPDTRHTELVSRFEEYGRIVGTKMPMVEQPFAYIEFDSSIHATAARGKLHHSLVRGERLEVHFENKVPQHLRASSDGSPPPPPPPPPSRKYQRRFREDNRRSHPYNRRFKEGRNSPPPPPPPPPPASRGYQKREETFADTPEIELT